MKYFLIAGEASGDLHASNLMLALRQEDTEAQFVGLGGDKMRAAGCRLFVDYRQMAYMGFVDVFLNLGKISRNFRIAKQALLDERPDILILIDYPSFNLKMAKYCRKHLPQTKIIYYIPPKIWAWKEWRVHQIAHYCDQILGIFPFEPAFYAKHGYQCQYVGNPVSDAIRKFKSDVTPDLGDIDPISPSTSTNAEPRIIAILPGSRPSEISHCLPTMLAAARSVAGDQYRIVVTAAPGIEDEFYRPFLQAETLTRDTYTLLSQAHAAVVNSGTATLETALIGCPQTAVYYVAASKYIEWIAKPIMFRIQHFTLVNIIAQQEVIQELVASRFTQANIEQELTRLLNDDIYRTQILRAYAEIQSALGNEPAATNAAQLIVQAARR